MKKAVLLGVCAFMMSQVAFAQDTATDGRHEAMREKMKERLMAVDTNGDGSIDKAEFMAKAEEKFAKMDGNSDGVVTPEEMKALKGQFQGSKDGGAQFP